MGHPRGRFQPGSGSGSRNFNRGNRPAGNHMAESSWARPAVNHVAESSWARPPANSIAETNPKVDGSQFMGNSEDQLKQLLSLVSKNDGSISQANAVTKPGSGYEEDDWFG
ncbi:hypothetical protein OIU77_002078 [Salix suchowensis]|uniref:Uncharacterized protein n=1 Tax=Salix suchowensis TaxID=1278906 RepID=A0ABQ9B4X4_9ROSI|nr:hypothetical protein OIU77_002078 [Salix suchowensis]